MTHPSGLPKQVVEQAELAEQFMATLKGKPKEEEDTATGDESTEDEEEQETEGTAEGDDELETADQIGAEDDGEDGDELDEEEETFRRRYETLRGKYDAEVPKLNKELRELKDSIFEKLGNINSQVEQPVVETATADEGISDEEISELRERFGDDLVDFMIRLSDDRIKKSLGENLASVSQKVDSVEQTQIATAQAQFATELSSKVDGDWQSIVDNKDPKFTAFLETKEPNGFFTYKELAAKANASWDSDMLSAVFNAYLATQKPPVKQKKENGKERNLSEKDKQRVTPARQQVASEPDGAEPKIWTQADIKRFQEDDRRGKIPAEESQALWNDLLRAPSEGRIIN